MRASDTMAQVPRKERDWEVEGIRIKGAADPLLSRMLLCISRRRRRGALAWRRGGKGLQPPFQPDDWGGGFFWRGGVAQIHLSCGLKTAACQQHASEHVQRAGILSSLNEQGFPRNLEPHLSLFFQSRFLKFPVLLTAIPTASNTRTLSCLSASRNVIVSLFILIFHQLLLCIFTCHWWGG